MKNNNFFTIYELNLYFVYIKASLQKVHDVTKYI